MSWGRVAGECRRGASWGSAVGESRGGVSWGRVVESWEVLAGAVPATHLAQINEKVFVVSLLFPVGIEHVLHQHEVARWHLWYGGGGGGCVCARTHARVCARTHAGVCAPPTDGGG